MSLLRALAKGLRALLHRRAADQEIGDEVEHYLAEATQAGIARGLSPEQARRAARIELGSPTSVRQEVRSSGWEHSFETVLADLRYAARRLRKYPASTALIVLTLALGIGATSAIFSAVHPILLKPLPYPHPDRVMMIWEGGDARVHGTFGAYLEIQARVRSFEAVAVVRSWQPTLTGADRPERLEAQLVSAPYFQVLGVLPALGRSFQDIEDRLNGSQVVVLSHRLWLRRFSADSAVLGRTVTLNDEPYAIVGVMPQRFENVLAPDAELWAPLQYDMTLGTAWGHHLRTVARLAPGAGPEDAGPELDAVAATLQREQSDSYGNARLSLVPLQDDLTRGVKPLLLAVLGAVALVLLIACVNVTGLLLARGATRRGELAVRVALGAGRGRVVRQLLTESALLALIGGLVGMAVAEFGVRALVALSPPGLPRASEITLNRTVFLFGLLLTTIVGLGFGLFPALAAARDTAGAEVQQASLRITRRGHRLRSALVVAEVALAIMLLAGTGLLLRSLQRLFAIDPGFDPRGLLTIQIQASDQRFPDNAALLRYFDQALEAVRRQPGVESAVLTSQLPFSGDLDEYGASFEGEGAGRGSVYRYSVSPGYFETMRIPLVEGRYLGAEDVGGAPLSAVISESLARRHFRDRSPLGQRFFVGSDDGPRYTVVGVVRNVRQVSLALSESDAVYVTNAQWRFSDNVLSLLVRTGRNPAALAPEVRNAIWSVDKDQPIVRVATMGALLGQSAAERRFALSMFGSFALVALLLAAAGIYGVLSGRVAERQREIGVRSALGATRGSIVSMVARQGFALAALGSLAGVAGALAASRVLTTLMFGISRLDPVTYLGVIVVLMGVTTVACWVPAWRAARIDPVITLKSE